jgi:flavin reductase (DIM6/NTAB) family NADH-FMN oxidoreductase RutF
MDINALFKLTYGLYVIGVKDEANDRPGGFIIDAVAQISMDDEPTVIVSVMNKNYSKENIDKQGVFNLSILPEDVDPFVIANFGFQTSKEVDKWVNVPHTLKAGLPVLDSAIAWVQFKVIDKRVMGTHTAFFCTPVDAEVLADGKNPLIYADYFSKLKDKTMQAFREFKEKQ